MKRLAVITTHPIQYNAPWFRLLAQRKKIAVKVFYTWSQVEHQQKFDPGFGKNIQWDIPVLEGYDYTFVNNISKEPGSKTFKGIDNPTLTEEIEAWNPNAVLIFGWKFKSHLKAMKYFHGRIPVLFRGDSHLLGRGSGLKGFIRKLVLKRVFKNIDYSLYVGQLNKQYFLSAGMQEAQLVHCPHTIDIDFFSVNDETRHKAELLRQQLRIPEKDLVFLFAGKFEETKNPFLLLEAAKEIKDSSVHFVFIGNGPLEEEMKRSAGTNIHFMDFQNQQAMPAVYQMCDIYVLCSRSETWGLAVNEAMACGKPVLVSDRCGCAPDLVEEDETGWIFKSGDKEDLKNKIEEILHSRDRLPKMGENAFNKIQDWSFEKIVVNIENLVNSL
ncbi:MAG: glycosyltransferase family 4 protein [Chitinophagaceae bacterium]|nr:glycosyltransferase family 4 protein [Chitinophagaceae bacterium]